MKYLLALILVGTMIAGCSSRPSVDEPAKETDQGNRGIPDVAPEGRITEEAAQNEADSSLPVMTADSPPILLTPIQGMLRLHPLQTLPHQRTGRPSPALLWE
jgi:hypothetical protein